MKRLLCCILMVAAGAAVADDLDGARARHAADIAYWTSTYGGEDLTTGKYACVMPNIPAISTQINEIRTIYKGVRDWAYCYNRFASELKATGPSMNRIPPDIRKLMTPDELAQAIRRIDMVLTDLVQRRDDEAQAFTAQRAEWLLATDKYLGEVRPQIAKFMLDNEYDMNRRTFSPHR